jgi:hypothetical protein
MLHKKRSEWFRKTVKDRLKKYDEVKFVSYPNSDLGALEVIEFNSNEKCGFINFWSSGYIGFQIVDCNTVEEIVKDTLLEIPEGQSLEDILSNFIDNI